MRVRHHLAEVQAYRREAASLADFARLMRVRLSQTPLGPLVCPKPTTVAVRLRAFGPEPLWLRSHTTDVSVLNEQLLSHGYEPMLERSAGASVIVDLGANTGIVSRWLLARHPGARIVCVEPAEENVAMLRRNLAPLGARAAIVDRCIGGTARPVTVDTTNGAWAYRMDDAAAGEANSSTVTMDDVLAEHDIDAIDLLKCDVEGAEWEMFERCESWIDRVDALIIELHGGTLARLQGLVGDRWTVLSHAVDERYDCETITLARPRDAVVAA